MCRSSLNVLDEVTENSYNVKINKKKAKILKYSKANKTFHIKMENEIIQELQEFSYLGESDK